MFELKSHVQALDPQCGIWLSAKVLELLPSEVKLKWMLYSEPSIVDISNVRAPILKRQYKLQVQDWRDVDPKNLQRGDIVEFKRPDGTTDGVVTVDENDPWKGAIKAGGRNYLYEYIRQAAENNRAPANGINQHNEKRNRPVASLVSSPAVSEKVTPVLGKRGQASQKGNRRPTAQTPSVTKASGKVTPVGSKRENISQKENRQPYLPKPLVTKDLKKVTPAVSKRRRTSQKENRPPSKQKPPVPKDTEKAAQKKRPVEDGDDKIIGNKSKNAAPKKKKVLKERANTLVISPAAIEIGRSPLSQNEYQVVENLTTQQVQKCDVRQLIRYGMQTLHGMDNIGEPVSETSCTSSVSSSLTQLNTTHEPEPSEPSSPHQLTQLDTTYEPEPREPSSPYQLTQLNDRNHLHPPKPLVQSQEETSNESAQDLELPPPLSPLSPRAEKRQMDKMEEDIQALKKEVKERGDVIDNLKKVIKDETDKRVALERTVSDILEKVEEFKRILGVPQVSTTPTPAAENEPTFSTPEQLSVSAPLPSEDPPLSTPIHTVSTRERHFSTPSTLVPPPEHFHRLKEIHRTVLGDKVGEGSTAHYRIQPTVLTQVVGLLSSPPSLARALMRELFTRHELSIQNVRGIGKAALDPARVETIRVYVFHLCGVPPMLHQHCWAACVKVMDQANRNSRHYSRKLTL